MFVIKGTYKQGENKDKSFYLGKTGIYIPVNYIHSLDKIQTYDSLKTARMVATRFNQKNYSDENRYPHFTVPIHYTAVEIKSTML